MLAIYTTGITKTINWLRTLNIDIHQGRELRHTGFPYYFTTWGVDPLVQQWKEIEWIAQKPRGLNQSHSIDWDLITYIPIKHDSWPDKKPEEGKLLDRGGITVGSKTYKLYSAHFPQGYLYPPPASTPIVKQAPMIVPDMSTPAQVILFPKVRKVEMVVDLQVLVPPKHYCPEVLVNQLQYTTPLKIGRKPLQLMALGVVLAGALMGGIMGGGVSAAMIQPIKAQLLHINQLNKLQKH